jgi:hypothetical protein
MTYKVAIASLVATGTLLAMFAPTVETASAEPAKFVRCLTTPLTVSSEDHGLWGTTDRTHNAVIGRWQSAVTTQIGTNYANWSNALGGDVNCHRNMFKVVCVATATPCRS